MLIEIERRLDQLHLHQRRLPRRQPNQVDPSIEQGGTDGLDCLAAGGNQILCRGRRGNDSPMFLLNPEVPGRRAFDNGVTESPTKIKKRV